MSKHTERQEVEIQGAGLPGEKLLLVRCAGSECVGVHIHGTGLNRASLAIRPTGLLLAVQTLCGNDGEHPPSAIGDQPSAFRSAPGQYAIMRRVLDLVAAERARQRAMLASGKIHFDCAAPETCLDRSLRVLTEELGEVAKGIDELDQEMRKAGTPRFSAQRFTSVARDLRTELIQVAAVACAMAESLTEDDEAQPPQAQPENLKT